MNLAETKHAPLATEQCHRETMVYQHPDPDRGYVIQLMDHHHHHQHQSGTQKGAKSVIYMIVTGDGLHNFFDGLAIGIAFASGIGGGISTSVAVLCHELPHEVGDFAVLIKAGLAAKKAVMYNTLSAFLCFIGMTVGILVAKMDTGMLSAIIAGMFLYIALVDMIPQLDCCPTATGTTRAFKLSVQLIGMGIGVSIMSVISIYEPNLQQLMSS
jgi:zinc transporter 10